MQLTLPRPVSKLRRLNHIRKRRGPAYNAALAKSDVTSHRPQGPAQGVVGMARLVLSILLTRGREFIPYL